MSLKFLLNTLFENFNNSRIQYAVVGNYDSLPEYTSNDVDIWVKNISKADKVLMSIIDNNGFNLFIKNKRANGINYLIYYQSDDNIDIIKIDFLENASFKSIFNIIDSKFFTNNIVPHKNFKVINNDLEAIIHFLHPLINKKILKKKYRNKILLSCENAFFFNSINKILGSKHADYIIKAIKANNWNLIEERANKYRAKIIIDSFYKFSTYSSIYKFIKTAFYRLFRPSGYVIAFIGPDGVGKTTIINEISKFSNDIFLKKTINYYWRPFLFPPLHKLLFSNKNKSKFGKEGRRKLNVSKSFFIYHYLKFFYYLFDFIFGKLKYINSYTRGGLIVFDRYYHDMIIYCERFGFSVSKRFLSFFYYFINKPNITFYLHAPADVLVKRKKELSYKEIQAQHLMYMDICSKNSNIIDISTNQSIEKVKKEIIYFCLSNMSKKFK